MKSKSMEIIQVYEDMSDTCNVQSQWLQATTSGVNEKMKAVVHLLEDSAFTTQNPEAYENRKEAITKILKELSTSFCSLAQDYEHLKSKKHKDHSSRSWDDSQLTEVIDSNPGSVVEDPEIVYSDDTVFSKDESNINKKKTRSDGTMKLEFTKLVEENTELQIELVKRNSEKRETISKLQEEVNRLRAEKEALKRHLSYVERNKSHFQLRSSSRRSMFVDKFFRCSF